MWPMSLKGSVDWPPLGTMQSFCRKGKQVTSPCSALDKCQGLERLKAAAQRFGAESKKVQVGRWHCIKSNIRLYDEGILEAFSAPNQIKVSMSDLNKNEYIAQFVESGEVISQWLPRVHEPLHACLIAMECRKPVKQ